MCRYLLAFVLALVAAGCRDPYAALKATDWYQQHAAEVLAEKEKWANLPRIGGYNDAVVVGTIASQDVSNYVSLEDVDVLVSQYRIRDDRMGFSCGRTDFPDGRLPRLGERWAVRGGANGKGWWYLRSALPLDAVPSADGETDPKASVVGQ